MYDNMERMINTLYRDWSDSFGLITNDSTDDSGTNGIVFTAEFIILCHMLGFNWNKDDVKKILNQFFDSEGIRQRPNKSSKEDPASHDNLTAIMSLSYIYNLEFHKKYKVLNTKVMHLRDIAYYSALKYPSFQWLFVPIVGLFMIDSCWSKFEYNPMRFFQRMKPVIDEHYLETKFNKYTDATSYTYVRMKYVSTSTKLLCFLRFKTLNFVIFEKICNHFLRKNFGKLFWNDIFLLYFKNPNHANVRLIDEHLAQVTGNTDSNYH